MAIVKEKRKSGVELLRIVAIFGVIMIHYFEAIRGYVDDSASVQVLLLLRSLCASAVDVFVIISGYYLVNSNNRKLGKALTLFVQVSLFSELFYFINIAIGVHELSLRHIVSSIIPQSYYTTLYVVLYFISPYINFVLNKLNHRDLKVMIVSLFACFSVYSIIITFYSEVINIKWFGLNPVGAWGSQQGFNIVNFILLYMIGAYIRLIKLDELLSKKIANICFWACTILICIWAEVNQQLPHFGQISGWCYDNPIVILQGVFLFMFFKKLNISSIHINRLATAAYTAFLIHFMTLSNISTFIFYQGITLPDIIVRYILFALTMYLLSWGVFEIYNIATRRLFEVFDKAKLIYFTENKDENHFNN